MICVKRVYEPASDKDGYRILADRLWPRGLTKEKVQADLWLKEVAPSTALRKWFEHDPAKWEGFEEKYKAELAENEAFKELKALLKKHKTITLLYAARDEQHNEAKVLADLLKEKGS